MPKASPDFEKNFADLAYSYINNNAPKLLDHMVGFQVLDNNEEESKAVGVFGFSVGGRKKEMFYAPVFFVNGKLKGQELLYNGTADLFIPMEESWVDFIMNKKPLTIGDASPDTRGYLGTYLPNFRDIMGRGMSKGASAAEVDPDAPLRLFGHTAMGKPFDLVPAMGMFLETRPGTQKSASTLDLASVVRQEFSMLHVLAARMTQNPDFTKMACSFYDVTDFVPEAPAVPALTPQVVVKAAKVQAPRPRVVSGDQVFDMDLDAEQKQDYIKSGFVVIDERKPEDVNEVIEGDLAFASPSSNGYYDLVFEDKSVKRCLVARLMQEYRNEFLILDPESNDFWCRESVFSLHDCPAESLKVGKKGFEALKEGTTDRHGFVVQPNGSAFRVGYGDKIIESPNVSTIVKTDNTFVVPKGVCGFVPVTDGHSFNKIGPIDTQSLRLSDVFTGAIIKAASLGGANMRFAHRGSEVRTHSRLEALSYLVQDLGLSKSAAEHVISSALDTDRGYEFVIKKADATWVDDYDPEAPDVSMENIFTGVEPWSGAMVTEDHVDDRSVQGLPVNETGDYGEMDPDVYGTMERAVATKQKDVFDVAVLGSLLKATDVSNLVDKYVPDMITAVDRFGRNLFLLYHKSDEFKERYGDTDLADLEDTLKNAFTTVGKLVLFLKKRSISADIDDHDISV